MNNYDLIIIGAGPGAVQVAIKLEELANENNKKINYIMIDENSVTGSFFNVYPVHGKLISNNKLYTGSDPKSDFSERFDWNSIITKDKKIMARHYSSDFYPDSSIIPKMLKDLKDAYNLPVNFNERCQSIRKEGDLFKVLTEKGTYTSKFVINATGFKPNVADIKGIELATPYVKMKVNTYYRDKSVMIIGKGNSGLECAKDILNEANMILLAGTESIRFAYQTHYVGSPRIVNSVPIENYQLKSLSAILDCNILNIKKENEKYVVTVKYTHAKDEIEDIVVDELIASTGFKVNLPDIQPEITYFANGFPKIDGNYQSTEVKGLYFAGAVTHGIDYKKYSSSGFIHGFRYNSIALATNIFEQLTETDQAKHIKDMPITDYIFEKLNNDAGIYLQPGFIGIHIIVQDDQSFLDKGYLSIDAYKSMENIKQTHILLTLEYGDIKMETDPLAISRTPGVPAESVHIHPVIRIRAEKGDREIILEENLFNKFNQTELNRSLLTNGIGI